MLATYFLIKRKYKRLLNMPLVWHKDMIPLHNCFFNWNHGMHKGLSFDKATGGKGAYTPPLNLTLYPLSL